MKLYKFKSLEGDGLLHSLDMIVNERIYLSTCDFMNDPYEGAWYQKEALSLLCNGDADDHTKQAAELYSIVKKTKFTSFTKRFKDTLLWAHYASGFTGVCFEFELSKKKHDIRRIDYDRKDGKPVISKADIEKVLKKSVKPQDIGILRSKAKCWKYEGEYRIFSNKNYIEAKPTRIIFGKTNYNNIFLGIAKKYDIQISFLDSANGKYSAYDLKRNANK